MNSWKWKLLLPIMVITVLISTKYVLWDFPISSGKRVGNLTKISKKGKIYPTWEGTVDEGSGDKLTSHFSVRDNSVGEELYNYEGRQVIIYYEQYLVGWPYDTKYNVISWKPKEAILSNYETSSLNHDGALDMLSKTLFCSLLGSIYTDPDLYQKVKEHVRKNNLFLFQSIDKCNE